MSPRDGDGERARERKREAAEQRSALQLISDTFIWCLAEIVRAIRARPSPRVPGRLFSHFHSQFSSSFARIFDKFASLRRSLGPFAVLFISFHLSFGFLFTAPEVLSAIQRYSLRFIYVYGACCCLYYISLAHRHIWRNSRAHFALIERIKLKLFIKITVWGETAGRGAEKNIFTFSSARKYI